MDFCFSTDGRRVLLEREEDAGTVVLRNRGALRLFSGVSQWLVPWLYPNKGAAVDGAKPAVEGRWGDWLIPNKLWTLVPQPLC